ncbi:bile acid:sodium symporter family protein [Haloparvum sp. PAK95]|uniref:bile acid:sodium symporter family protein n=1 Tax=Haloparvum sp. PAK95 TaxID=3418962 RepID=UPI003D2EEEA4
MVSIPGISGAELVELVTTVFVLSTMFSMGVQVSISQLVNAVRQGSLLTKSIAVNLVAIPLLAALLVRLISVEPGYAAGFLLLAVSPGAPFGPKLAEISDSDVAFASGLMAILCALSVVTIPVSLVLLLPGSVVVDPLAIGQMVLGIQIVPLVAGLGLSVSCSSLAARLQPPIQRLSDYTFIGLIVLLVVVYSADMASLVGTGTLGLSAIAVAVSLALGYGLGGPARATREVLATTTAARNAAIALFIATTSFSDPEVLTTVLAFSFIGVVASGVLATLWRDHSVP